MEVLMSEYIKTSISRKKLYDRNYTRDSFVKIKRDEDMEVSTTDNIYKSVADILTLKYIEKSNV